MTDVQLYLAVGLPSFVAMVGILVNVGYFVTLNGRVSGLEQRLDGRMSSLEQQMNGRITRLEDSLVGKIDLLTGKVIEIDNRLTRVEEQLKHMH